MDKRVAIKNEQKRKNKKIYIICFILAAISVVLLVLVAFVGNPPKREDAVEYNGTIDSVNQLDSGVEVLFSDGAKFFFNANYAKEYFQNILELSKNDSVAILAEKSDPEAMGAGATTAYGLTMGGETIVDADAVFRSYFSTRAGAIFTLVAFSALFAIVTVVLAKEQKEPDVYEVALAQSAAVFYSHRWDSAEKTQKQIRTEKFYMVSLIIGAAVFFVGIVLAFFLLSYGIFLGGAVVAAVAAIAGGFVVAVDLYFSGKKYAQLFSVRYAQALSNPLANAEEKNNSGFYDEVNNLLVQFNGEDAMFFDGDCEDTLDGQKPQRVVATADLRLFAFVSVSKNNRVWPANIFISSDLSSGKSPVEDDILLLLTPALYSVLKSKNIFVEGLDAAIADMKNILTENKHNCAVSYKNGAVEETPMPKSSH